MFQIGKTMLLVLMATLVACSHPLESEGEGDIISSTGTRDCLQGQYPCENFVADDYIEGYSGMAAPGYTFVGWRGCDEQFPTCVFNVPASTVQQFWGHTAPPLVAVFRSINLIQTNPAEGGVLSDSGQHDCSAGQTCVIKGSDTKGFGQVFTANPSEGYRFDGWARNSGNPFCDYSTYPCEMDDGWASSVAQSDVYYAAQRGWLDIDEDWEIELTPTFRLLAPGSLAGGGDQLVETPPSGDPYGHVIAALPDGGYIIVWSASHSLNARSILGQRFDEGGAAVGEVIQIDSEAITYKSVPHVVALESNRFLVSWQAQGTDYQRSDIVARIFNIDGSPVTNEMNITANDIDTNFYRPINTPTPDGGYIITWQGNSSGSFAGTSGQRFDATGQPIGEPLRFGIEGGYSANVAYLNDGASVTAWALSLPIFYEKVVKLRCVSPEGQLLGENSTGDYEQFLGGVTALNDDAFVVTWHANNRDFIPPLGAAQSGVFARVFARDCSALSDEILVNTYTYGNQYGAQTAPLKDGGFAIAWESEFPALDNSSDVYIQRFSALGEKLGAEVLVNTFISDSQGEIDIAALANGEIAAVWQSSRRYINIPTLHSKLMSMDSDGDLLPDTWEQKYGLDPAFPYDALVDSDEDGTHNLDEFMNGGNPLVNDTN